jgi:predicted permease
MRNFIVFRRRPSESEIARELRDHVQLEADDLVALGSHPASASDVARRRFGNVALVQEATRETWGSLWFERLEQDVRFGLRMLRRSPAFSVIAVLCLGLGIGANAAVLSWSDGIVRHPFPGVRGQDRLVVVVGTAKGASGFDVTSWPDFMDLSRSTTAFSAFIISKITGTTITGGDRAEQAVGQVVTANYFDALGVRPILGRGFRPDEDVGRGAQPVTVISYRLWQDRFGGDPRVLGSTISYSGVRHTIVGVTPEAFNGTFVGYAMQFWVPACQQAGCYASGYKLEDRTARWVEGFAMLKPGVTLAQAQAQMNAAARRLEEQYPNEDRGRGIRVLPLRENPFDNSGVLRPILRVGSLVAALVLLIVCANIANLLLVRALARRSEIAVRYALGAGRARLVRQLITEGFILAIFGTAVGLIVAFLSRNVLGLFFAPRGGVSLVFSGDFNWRVLAITIAIGLTSTTVFAALPAFQTIGLNLAQAIRVAAPGANAVGTRGRLRSALVLVQVSLSVVLLVGAGLMVVSLSRLLASNPGFATTDVTTTAIGLRAARYDTARAHRFEDELVERARDISGVSFAALSRSLPFAPRPYENGPILVDGYQPSRDEQPTADYNAVTPGYFQTLAIPLLSGRDFSAADADTSAPVAIVAEALAQRYWPNTSPIGKRLQLRGRWMRVVGVAGDIKYRSLIDSPSMLFYVPLAQDRSTSVNLFVRSARRGASVALRPAIVTAIHAIDPNVSPYEILTMREQVNRATSAQQIMVTLLIIFGGVALLLAAVGLYGVISYTVSQSTRELGLRTALGATPLELMRLILGSGLRLTGIGVVVGVIIALRTTTLLGDLLFRISPRDPAVIGVAIGVTLLSSIVACLVPAWRAAHVDPARALRA